MTEPTQLTTVTCACGFSASGRNEQALDRMLFTHECGNKHWYDALFSTWGALIAGAVAYAAVEIVKTLGL